MYQQIIQRPKYRQSGNTNITDKVMLQLTKDFDN